MPLYVDRLLEPLSESDRQTLGKFLNDSRPPLSFDEPLSDLAEPLPLNFQQSR